VPLFLEAGYDYGSCEGKHSASIRSVLRKIQEENGLPFDSLNITTLEFLGVDYLKIITKGILNLSISM